MSGYYMGPFVKVKVPMKTTTDSEPWCDKCDKRRGDTNFCQDCGTSVSLKERKIRVPTPHWSVPATLVLRYAVTNGNLNTDMEVEYIYTIGNGHTNFNERQEDEDKLKKFWHGDDRRYGPCGEDFQHIIFKEEIAWLRARCKKEIESLCRVFGEENVGFGWGLVTTWR